MRAPLDAGADIEAKADYWADQKAGEGLTQVTPVFFAGTFMDHPGDDIKTLELFLARGANPNAVESYRGLSLLMWRTISGWSQPKALEVLLKAGAKIDLVDKEGQTALHLAARSDNAEAVQPLVKANHTRAFLEARDKSGRTALLHAVAPTSLRAVEFPEESEGLEAYVPTVAALVRAGADIFARDNSGATVLHLAAATESPRAEFRIAYFLQKGFKPIDIKDKQGATPLFIACQSNDIDVVRLLLASGASPDVRTNTGSSPRQIVSRPLRTARPQASIPADKKAIEEMYKQIDQHANQVRREILALMNRTRPPLKRQKTSHQPGPERNPRASAIPDDR